MNENDDLPQLFRDATADIRPRGTYDEIRARTEKVDPSARRWFLPAVVAALVLGIVIGGAFWLNRDDGTSTASPTAPVTGGTTSADPTGAPEKISVAAFYAGDTAAGPRLFYEEHTLSICIAMTCRLQAGLTESLGGHPLDPDYRSLWPADTQVDPSTTSVDDSKLTIGLTGRLADRPAGMSASVANVALQQLLRTAQAAADPGDRSVVWVLNGKATDRLLGSATPTRTIAEGQASSLDVVAPVQIITPTSGEKVKAGDLLVQGEAAAFEGNVVWELLVGGDAVVDSGTATAEECCTLSPYSFTIKNLQPGTYTLVVHDTDESGAGKPVNRDSKEIVVE